MFALQSPGINATKFDAPQANRFTADSDPSFSEQIFYIAMTKVEAIVEPDSIRNAIWREPVSFIGIHGPILAIWPSQLGSTFGPIIFILLCTVDCPRNQISVCNAIAAQLVCHAWSLRVANAILTPFSHRPDVRLKKALPKPLYIPELKSCRAIVSN